MEYSGGAIPEETYIYIELLFALLHGFHILPVMHFVKESLSCQNRESDILEETCAHEELMLVTITFSHTWCSCIPPRPKCLQVS